MEWNWIINNLIILNHSLSLIINLHPIKSCSEHIQLNVCNTMLYPFFSEVINLKRYNERLKNCSENPKKISSLLIHFYYSYTKVFLEITCTEKNLRLSIQRISSCSCKLKSFFISSTLLTSLLFSCHQIFISWIWIVWM